MRAIGQKECPLSSNKVQEQQAEIERLKVALTTVARACGVVDGSPSAEFLVAVIEGWKKVASGPPIVECPAPAAESGKWYADREVLPMGHGVLHQIRYRGKLTDADLAAAADWLEKRSEIESQLAKYKRAAEAWEAVRKHRIFIAIIRGKWYAVSADTTGSHCDDPADAVLSLAARRASQADQKGDG